MDGLIMSVEHRIQEMIDRFQSRVENDPELREELMGLRKKVHLDLGEEQYRFVLEDGQVHSFSHGGFDDADIRVMSDPETVEGLLTKRIRPMKALARRRLRFEGEVEDLMRFRKFL
ncbi:MAG: SCP2 sterol-binding domain-containing protein [Thermoplasmatota archaeon]